MSHIVARRRSQNALTRAYDLQEISVRERTSALAESNRLLQVEIESRKNIEEELRQAKNNLEDSIKARTAQLLEANKKLQAEIQERITAENKLEAERRRLFSVLDEIPASVHLLAPDHSIKFANRYFRERFGDQLNRPCHKILHNSDTPCNICEAEEVFKKKIPGEFEELHSDGRLYHVYDYPFRDINGDDLILQLGIDITDRKQAENNLRKSEKKFRGLVNSMNDTVFTLNANYIITDIYGTHFEDLGLHIFDCRGKMMAEVFGSGNKTIHEDSLKEASSGKTVIYEWDMDLPKGKTFFQNSLSPIFDQSGKITGIVGVARDITKHKYMERQIIQTEKLMAVAQMSAMISHEFRNSLTSLKMILELQMESEVLQEPERKSLGVALSSISHMENIVGQLVTFSRPGPVEIGPLNINEVIEESVQFIHVHIKKHNIKLVKELDGELPIMNLDVLRIKEVISNLLLNSVQELAMNSTEVRNKKIKISTKKIVLTEKIWDQSYSQMNNDETGYQHLSDSSELFLSGGDECIMLQVEDNGSGIDAKNLKQIFNPFYTTKSSGTGLGLPLVKRIVNEHMGIINVKSGPDRGSKFTVYLPIKNHETA